MHLACPVGRVALTHLCLLLCSVSAALANFFRMDSNSTSYTFSSNLRIRAHFQPPRPVDSTAYLTPPSWVSMARANPVHRSLHRPPRTSRTPRGPSLQTEHSALSACDTVSPQAKPHSPCSSRATSHEQGNPRDPTLMTDDQAASLHPPRRAAPRSTQTPPASDLHFLTAGPLARRKKRSPNAPDSTHRPIPTPPRCCTPPGPTPAYTRHEEQAGTARARTTKTPPPTAQAIRHGVLRTPVVPSLSNVAPEMAKPPKTSEQRIDAAVLLLRPRGPRTRGRSTVRGKVPSSQQKVLKQATRRVSALVILWVLFLQRCS